MDKTLNSQSPKNMNTWYTLREFETRDITSRSYHNRHALELSASKAREISSNFIQAREYFRNASEAEFAIRPLLQYYGIASLSRGLTLFLEPNRRETSLKPSHGLQVCDWRQELANGLTGIGSLRTRLTEGLFHDLLVATDNKFYFRHNSSGVNWSIGANIPTLGSEFTLEEIVARIPDVSDQYNVWAGKPIPFMVLKSFEVDRANDLFKFVVAAKDERVDSVFPTDRFPNRSVTGDSSDLIVECRSTDGPFFAQKVGIWEIGDVVLYGPLKSNLYFTPLAACFMLSFTLGMLCRYFPTTWINIGRFGKGDAFYPLAIRLLDWIQDTFPAMVVDALRGPYDFETISEFCRRADK